MNMNLIYIEVTRSFYPQHRENNAFIKPAGVTGGDEEESPQPGLYT